MAEVVTFGETMALVTPTDIGPLSSASSLRLSIAGAESNVAIGLARLGHLVRWIGGIGDDEFGRLVIERLRGTGVEVAPFSIQDAPTGVMFKFRRTKSVSRVMYYRKGSAGARLALSHLPDDAFSGARVLHATGITPALSPSAREATAGIIQRASERGVLVSLDINYRSALWSRADASDALRELVASADLLFADEDELALLADGETWQDRARAVLRLGPREVLVKRGDRGAIAVTNGGTKELPAFPVDEVDPVGAGDAFVAGYLSGLLDGLDIGERLERACAVGALCVSVSGDWEGLPRREELNLIGVRPGSTIR